MKIDLPWLSQEQDYSCLPACVRIVLSHFGMNLSEQEIGLACKTTPRGTDLDEAAAGLISLGLKVMKLKQAGIDEILRSLKQQRPVIAFLSVQELPYGFAIGMHAVVVNGYEENQVSFIDPARGEEITISMKTFLKAWRARACRGLIIEK